MFILTLAKTALQAGAATGAGYIVGSVIANQVPRAATPLMRLSVYIGTASLGGLAGKMASDYVGSIFDEVDAALKAAKEFKQAAQDAFAHPTVVVNETHVHTEPKHSEE